MNEIRQHFEAWADEYARQDKPAIAAPKWIAWDAWRAAYEAAEIAMKEKAANLASDLWEADENLCASPMCSEIPAAIRALPLSGAEESKK